MFHSGFLYSCFDRIHSSVWMLLQLFFQVGLDIRQALQQQRIERSALAVQNHLHGFFVGVGFFVAAVTGQCIIHIGQRDQLCADGDFIALQPIRIAAAIPAFVVPAGDLVGSLQKRLVCKAFGLLQHLCAQHTVGLDHRKFLCGQPAGLV